MDELFEDGRVDFFWEQDDLMAVAEALVISTYWFRARHTAQGVRNCGLGARPIGYDKVELREKLGPADLPLVQLFRCYEGLEVLVIRDYFKWLLCALKFRAPFFQGLDNGEEFLVVDLVVALWRCVLGRKEGNRAQFPVVIRLIQDASRSPVG